MKSSAAGWPELAPEGTECGPGRPVLAAYEVDLRGRRVLEFGCNRGRSSIVMAFLGAEVHGVDIDPSAVLLARCNAAQYRLDDVNLQPVADGRRLPFADQEFDFVLCNSVLGYVSPDHLRGVIAELCRVMKPGSPLFITGTSSRLTPKEVHCFSAGNSLRSKAAHREHRNPARAAPPRA